ncbi:transcriptional regulator [Bhargavaea cecembensis]|uniref:Transcriptional regulator n=1 Tax=Bhargavaea cecembensis TaxID=394098 RepID=A0A163FCP5_9BACL|nr:LCP family protein [Bhargavaea cecembensis]KZE38391.1 transcriptional regulator [Bhargavaea cecembensis]
MKRKEYRKRKHASKKKTIYKIIGMLTVTVLLLAGSYTVHLYKKAQHAADNAYHARDGSALREEKIEPYKDNVSILFIGVDDSESRNDSNSRSDALMLATLNNDDKSIKLLSIPRDSLVYIPEVGYQDKITHAHAFGGVDASIETVEELLDIPVDYFVKMNFNAFIDVVDALGGITVDVPYERIELDENDKKTIHLKPGLQNLDGRHALALARTRKADSDIERGKRQQVILKSMIEKAGSVSSVGKYGEVIDALGNNMTTDLSFDDMKAMIAYLNNGSPLIETYTLQGYDDSSTGVYYWRIDEENLQSLSSDLRSHLELETPLGMSE